MLFNMLAADPLLTLSTRDSRRRKRRSLCAAAMMSPDDSMHVMISLIAGSEVRVELQPSSNFLRLGLTFAKFEAALDAKVVAWVRVVTVARSFSYE